MVINLENKGLDKKVMIKLGIHIGGISKKRNPLMNDYLLEKKERKRRFYFLNIDKTLSSCIKLEDYLRKTIFTSDKSQILILSTKKQANDFLVDYASKLDIPYVINKWKGGLLTNFDTIKTKLKELYNLKKKDANEDYSSEKERKKIKIEIQKLENIYGGISNLHQKPSALFVIGRKIDNALREAKKMGIPIISICGISSNPFLADYAIPGNDSNTKSIIFFLDFFLKTIENIKKESHTDILFNRER